MRSAGNSGTGSGAGAGGADGGGGGAPGTFSGSGRDPRSFPGAAGAGGISNDANFGGGAAAGHIAGFGGGGAGSTGGFGGGGSGANGGGFGAGAGVGGGAGGGLGAGGAIFVEQGGWLTITGGSLSGNTVAGGAGTGGAGNGLALGSGIFMQGTNSLTLAPLLGQTLTVGDVIADEAGSGGAGSTQVVLSGAGTTALANTNTYSGNTILDSGALSLQAASAAGSGKIIFSYGDSATLVIGNGDIPGNLIDGFLPGDTIDLQGIGTATSATPGANNVLNITGGLTPVTLYLDPAQNLTGESFLVASDQHGGTDITAVTVGNDSPPHIFGAGVTLTGTDAAPLNPLAGVTVTGSGSRCRRDCHADPLVDG